MATSTPPTGATPAVPAAPLPTVKTAQEANIRLFGDKGSIPPVTTKAAEFVTANGWWATCWGDLNKQYKALKQADDASVAANKAATAAVSEAHKPIMAASQNLANLILKTSTGTAQRQGWFFNLASSFKPGTTLGQVDEVMVRADNAVLAKNKKLVEAAKVYADMVLKAAGDKAEPATVALFAEAARAQLVADPIFADLGDAKADQVKDTVNTAFTDRMIARFTTGLNPATLTPAQYDAVISCLTSFNTDADPAELQARVVKAMPTAKVQEIVNFVATIKNKTSVEGGRFIGAEVQARVNEELAEIDGKMRTNTDRLKELDKSHRHEGSISAARNAVAKDEAPASGPVDRWTGLQQKPGGPLTQARAAFLKELNANGGKALENAGLRGHFTLERVTTIDALEDIAAANSDNAPLQTAISRLKAAVITHTGLVQTLRGLEAERTKLDADNVKLERSKAGVSAAVTAKLQTLMGTFRDLTPAFTLKEYGY